MRPTVLSALAVCALQEVCDWFGAIFMQVGQQGRALVVLALGFMEHREG